MKTTLEIPDDLLREAKAKAALEGIRLKDLIARSLKIEVRGSQAGGAKRRRLKFPLLESRRKAELAIPDDAASQVEMTADRVRYEASL